MGEIIDKVNKGNKETKIGKNKMEKKETLRGKKISYGKKVLMTGMRRRKKKGK